MHWIERAKATMGSVGLALALVFLTACAGKDDPVRYTVAISPVPTGGSISFDPDSGPYPVGTVIRVTAVADPGFVFTEWRGDLTSAENPALLAIDGNKVVSAVFTAAATHSLTIDPAPDGGGIVLDPPGGTYVAGTVVTVAATPHAGHTFAGWTGALDGNLNPTTLTMDEDKVLSATFTALAPACPSAMAEGPICVSGWARYLVDPEDPSQVMRTLVTSETSTIEVRVYDPLAYAANPSVAPLAGAEANPANGTFVIEGIVVPPTGYIVLAVVDSDGGADFVFTAFPYPAMAGYNLLEKTAIAVTAAQNEAWSTAIGDGLSAAGCSAGRDTLYACGTWIGVYGFMDNGDLTPISGVVPRNGGGATPPEIPITKAFYPEATWEAFSPPASSAGNHTGETGAVIFPTASLSNFAGSCADLNPDSACETAGYTWPVRLGGAAPNAIFVQLMYPAGLE